MKKMTKTSITLASWLLGFFLFVATANAFLPAHRYHPDAGGCEACHGKHGAPSDGADALVPRTPAQVEAVCLSCHGPLGISAKKAASHNLHVSDPPLTIDDQGYITCRECHGAHDSYADNILMIGYNWDPEVDPTKNYVFSGPTIRVETVSTSLSSPIYCAVTFGCYYSDGDYNEYPDCSNTTPEFNIDGAFPGAGVCQICHDPHHNIGQKCTSCHQHNEGFAPAGCTDCHVGSGGGALNVSEDSPHSTTDTGYTCEECHSGHGTAGDVVIPNNIDVGIYYVENGESGISLGGSATSGDTEAEICWNCHDSYGVSEWGLNTDTNGVESNYNTGSLSGAIAPQWVSDDGATGATWSSAQSLFSYKTGAIQSTHSVNSAILSPGLDAVEDIRCSYCHDVHELNLAAGDTTSGAPYLRGNWMGNPYREDGAPQSGTVYGQYEWGPVPRGSVLNNEYGGYQIDQNNGDPTSGWSLASSAGLCTLCHGTDVDNMNQFGTASDDWVGDNGHSNAVIGGTGSNAVNIFYTSDRAPSGVNTDGANPDMGYANHSGVGYGFRGTHDRSFTHLPGMDGSQASKSDQPYGGSHYEWGASVNETTTDPQYHQFSCSKCHNPHASRLPRLMITNCLDTKHNTWDENAGDGGPSIGNSNQIGITLSSSTSPDNWLRTWSNTTSAQNCHRVAGNNSAGWSSGYGTGWNYVTPWTP